MLRVCSLATSALAPTPTSTWSRTYARRVAPSSASSPISGARKWSLRAVISTGWRAPSSGWRSVRWCCRWSREAPPNARCQRIGPALLFERLWHEVGCRAVLEELAAGRQFEFAAERAVFLTVLHRLFVSGSDRAAEKWRADYRIEGTEALQLHHLYRAMAWLGEPLAHQARASALTPRCRQGLVEEGVVARLRDPVARLSGGFTGTTSLSFEGRGGEELGRRGHSKDYRPDLHQMIVGLVMDQY